jgi:AraC family transcriptional regulator, glycine betaine-responsive activator
LAEIVTYLENNIEDVIGLDSLSHRFQISRRQLERLFKRYIGQTPLQFLMDMRPQYGRALLAETNCSVTEVSAACGFHSASHFSKRYREKFGRSPHRFAV